MKSTCSALVLLVAGLAQPAISEAGGGYVAGSVVVGAPGPPSGPPRAGYYHGPGGYYGPRGGYYGPRGGYYGPGVGVYLGGPWVWPWVWGPPAYYPPTVVYPPVVTVPPPVVYIEKGTAAPSTIPEGGGGLEPGYWYYCRERGAYYPAVLQCPGPWEKVPPLKD